MDTTLAPIDLKDKDLAKTIQVLSMRFENPEATITDLCKEVDLDRRQYYRKLAAGNEIVDVLRKLIMQSKRLELARIATSRHKVLEKLVTNAIKSDDIDELVKAMRYLDEHEDTLQDDLGAKPGIEDDAHQFLRQGPKITKQESRFASIRVSKDEDGSARIDLMEENDVIDITPEEDQSG